MLMNQSKAKEFYQNIALRIQPFQIKIELSLLGLLLIGLLLNEENPQVGSVLLIVSFSLLSMLYLIMGFKMINSEDIIIAFLTRITHWTSAIGLIGILFAIQDFPGAYHMLQVGIPSMALGLVGIVVLKIKYKTNKKVFDTELLRVLIITLSIAGFFLWGNVEKPNPIENPKIQNTHGVNE